MIIIKKDNSGVGSNFIRLLDWLWYAKYSKDEIYIDWNIGGVDLLARVFHYNNPERLSDSKFYDHFVGKFNELDQSVINERRKDISFYDRYNMLDIGVKSGYFCATPEVYFEKDFYLLRNTFNGVFNHRFSLTEKFKESLLVKTVKTLGIHLRFPSHYRINNHHGRTASLEIKSFFGDCAKFIYEKFIYEKFEKIYVACDIKDFYGILSKYFQDNQMIKISYDRLEGNTDWAQGNRQASDIVYNAFLDIFNLSQCDKLICGVSNLTLTTLIVNPNLEFEFFPCLRSLHTG
jgi:hypothetical protein